ncbi:MAG: hypothetical protein H0U85_04650 [Gemmatimonadales bacterium]|nr:hypothetical protein [Gemmatimonadales bacterium]
MLAIQIPVPPSPPDLPTIVQVQSSGVPMDPAAIVMIVIAGLVAVTLILRPIIRAFAARLEGRHRDDPAVQGEIEDLRARVHELEAGQVRMAELEERLDFAERMLVQPRPDAQRLAGGK